MLFCIHSFGLFEIKAVADNIASLTKQMYIVRSGVVPQYVPIAIPPEGTGVIALALVNTTSKELIGIGKTCEHHQNINRFVLKFC